MDWRLRYSPVFALVALVVVRMFKSDFLGKPVFPSVPWLVWLTWFFLAFVALGYLTAWALSPGFARLVTKLAKWGILPPALFIIVGLGVLLFFDLMWNELVASWCGACPTMNVTGRVTAAIFPEAP